MKARRKRLLLFFIAIAGLGLFAWWRSSLASYPSLTRFEGNCNSIKAGMAESEVHLMLGKPWMNFTGSVTQTDGTVIPGDGAYWKEDNESAWVFLENGKVSRIIFENSPPTSSGTVMSLIHGGVDWLTKMLRRR